MAVLHELLAVENGLAETANRITKEVTKTLGTKQAIFTGMTKEHTVFADADQHLVQATEHKEIQSTVDEQINFLNGNLAQYWDVTLQKEEANQRAKADIVIDGETLATDVPSIVLLGLESKLTSLLAVYNAIPTLDAATAWERDENYAKPNVFRTKYAEERQQSITTTGFVTASEATEFHPAQVIKQDSIDVVGKFLVTNFSAAITSHDKAKRIAKLTTLIRAVKKARQRANNTEVTTDLAIGSDLLNYINE